MNHYTQEQLKELVKMIEDVIAHAMTSEDPSIHTRLVELFNIIEAIKASGYDCLVLKEKLNKASPTSYQILFTDDAQVSDILFASIVVFKNTINQDVTNVPIVHYTSGQLQSLKNFIDQLMNGDTYDVENQETAGIFRTLGNISYYIYFHGFDSTLFYRWFRNEAEARNKEDAFYVIYNILFGRDLRDLPLLINHYLRPILTWRMKNISEEELIPQS